MKNLKNETFHFLLFFFVSAPLFTETSLPYISQPFHELDEICYQKPSYTEDAIRFLDNFLSSKKAAQVLEIGSGSSTIWLAKRTHQLVSIENHPIWYRIISNSLVNQHLDHVEYKLFPFSFSSIENIFLNESFDLIIIDITNSVLCLNYVLPKLRPGGTIMINNIQSQHLGQILKHLKRWHCRKTFQKNPYVLLKNNNRLTYWWEKPK